MVEGAVAKQGISVPMASNLRLEHRDAEQARLGVGLFGDPLRLFRPWANFSAKRLMKRLPVSNCLIETRSSGWCAGSFDQGRHPTFGTPACFSDKADCEMNGLGTDRKLEDPCASQRKKALHVRCAASGYAALFLASAPRVNRPVLAVDRHNLAKA